MAPEVAVPLGFFTMAVCIVVGLPLARAYARRMERTPPPQQQLPQSTELIARLDRIEQAIEVMATEVERITEGQRFVTKLLSETRQHAALGAASAPTALPPASSTPPADPGEGTVRTPSSQRP